MSRTADTILPIIFNNDQDIRRVLMQLINGEYAPDDPERFREIYDSLLNTKSSDRADTYFILADFKFLCTGTGEHVEAAYRDEKGWAKNGYAEHGLQPENSLPTVPSSSMWMRSGIWTK